MKSKNDLVGLSRMPIVNQAKSVVSTVTKPKAAYDMNGLVSENRWAWIKKNFGSIWRGRFKPYPTYNNPAVNNGIFKMPGAENGPVVITLLSDWATATAESKLIAAQAGIQDYSIHLGDTYYVGNDQEIAENFNTDHGGTWPYGRLGSFALIGNHEMYSSGKSFFTQLLPYMGTYKFSQDKPVQPQCAGFFCLENDYWRIIGLDTGYNSLTGFFGLTPNPNLDLTPEQMEWLQNTVKLSSDNRGIILLSHHQCYSAFEVEFPNPAKAIASLILGGRDVLWLWGHEHRFSVYGANPLGNRGNIFARCIGNGGMPVEIKDDDGNNIDPKSSDPKSPKNRNLVLYDQRQREVIDGKIPLGHNGYVLLTLNAAELVLSYYDDNNNAAQGRKILEENWGIDIATGKLSGKTITDFTVNGKQPAEQQLSLFGDGLTKAIGFD